MYIYIYAYILTKGVPKKVPKGISQVQTTGNLMPKAHDIYRWDSSNSYCLRNT